MSRFKIRYIDPETQEEIEIERTIKPWAEYTAEQEAHHLVYGLADKNLNYKIFKWVDAPKTTAKGYWVQV